MRALDVERDGAGGDLDGREDGIEAAENWWPRRVLVNAGDRLVSLSLDTDRFDDLRCIAQL